VTNAAGDYQQEQSYGNLFREIDSDNSGFIDVNELYHCVSSMFPDSQITMNDVQAMLNEADTNGDGNISADEFEVVMRNAQGKDSLWGKTQANLWSRFTRSIDDTIAVAESATAPLKSISRSNSYLDADGMQIAGGGLRIVAKIVSSFTHFIVSTLLALLVGIIFAGIKFEVYKEVLEIFGGVEYDSVGLSNIWSTVNEFVSKVFHLMTIDEKGRIGFANDWNKFESTPLGQDPTAMNCTLAASWVKEGEDRGLVSYVWRKCAAACNTTEASEDTNYLLTNNQFVICTELKTVGTSGLSVFLGVFLVFALTPLLINLFTWMKSQDFSQWLFGQIMVGKDGKRLNLTQMATINSFFIGRVLSGASLFLALLPNKKPEDRMAIIATTGQGFLVFTILSIIDGLPLMFYGKSALEWITETKCAVK